MDKQPAIEQFSKRLEKKILLSNKCVFRLGCQHVSYLLLWLGGLASYNVPHGFAPQLARMLAQCLEIQVGSQLLKRCLSRRQLAEPLVPPCVLP